MKYKRKAGNGENQGEILSSERNEGSKRKRLKGDREGDKGTKNGDRDTQRER